MTRPARDYLVYSCEGCFKRIFTERVHVGRVGVCPCCGRKHVVGGVRVAAEADERRATPRAKDERASVTLKGEARAGPLLADEHLLLGDVSETGISFKIRGMRDAPRRSGVRPPPLEVGDTVQITLHSPEQHWARSYEAEVRRVTAGDHKDKGLYTVGAQFLELDARQKAELKALVGRLLDR